jgi:hypothetical protein
MCIENIVPIVGGDEKNNTPMIILTSKITEIKKLQEAKMQAIKIARIQQWNKALWSQQTNLKNCLVLVIMFYGFQRVISHT